GRKNWPSRCWRNMRRPMSCLISPPVYPRRLTMSSNSAQQAERARAPRPDIIAEVSCGDSEMELPAEVNRFSAQTPGVRRRHSTRSRPAHRGLGIRLPGWGCWEVRVGMVGRVLAPELDASWSHLLVVTRHT